MIRIQIYLSKSIHSRLHKMKSKQKCSIAEVVRGILEEHFQNEDIDGKSKLLAMSELKITGGPKDISKNINQ